MILYMGTVSFDVVVPEVITRPPPGSVYRSPQLYEKLRRDMDADNSSNGIETVWRHPYKGGEWRPYIYKSLGEGEPCRNGKVTPLRPGGCGIEMGNNHCVQGKAVYMTLPRPRNGMNLVHWACPFISICNMKCLKKMGMEVVRKNEDDYSK